MYCITLHVTVEHTYFSWVLMTGQPIQRQPGPYIRNMQNGIQTEIALQKEFVDNSDQR